MRITIQNESVLNGTYDDGSLVLTSSLSETDIVTGIDAVKTASKSLWSGGTMMYTVEIVNDTELDYENPVFTDSLDPLITLVPSSVNVNDVEHAYTYENQLLTIELETIAAQSTVTVTFLVAMV